MTIFPQSVTMKSLRAIFTNCIFRTPTLRTIFKRTTWIFLGLTRFSAGGFFGSCGQWLPCLWIIATRCAIFDRLCTHFVIVTIESTEFALIAIGSSFFVVVRSSATLFFWTVHRAVVSEETDITRRVFISRSCCVRISKFSCTASTRTSFLSRQVLVLACFTLDACVF